MKRVFILLTVAVFFIIGCSDESGIVTPENQTKNVEWLSFKTTNASHGIESDGTTSTSVTEVIDGSEGGIINFNFNFIDFGGEDIKVEGKLKIPKDAFEGTRGITIEFNDGDPSIFLSPAGTTFQKNLKLSLSYKNLNMDGVSPHDLIAFAYIGSDGNTVFTNYQNLIVELNKNKISVIQAEIPHFSRFGFVKVAD